MPRYSVSLYPVYRTSLIVSACCPRHAIVTARKSVELPTLYSDGLEYGWTGKHDCYLVDPLIPLPPDVRDDEDAPEGFFVDRSLRWLVNEDEPEWWVEDSLGLRPQPYDHYRAQVRAEEIFQTATGVLPVLLEYDLSPAVRAAVLHLQDVVDKVRSATLQEPSDPGESCAPDVRSFRVHVYPIYRVSVEVEAASEGDAVETAEDSVRFSDARDVPAPRNREALEWAEEVAWYEVVEEGHEGEPGKWIRDSLGLRPAPPVTFAARHHAGELFDTVLSVLDALAAVPRLTGNVADAVGRLREVTR